MLMYTKHGVEQTAKNVEQMFERIFGSYLIQHGGLLRHQPPS